MSAAAPANGSQIIEYRDSLSKAVLKNVLVLAIGLSINYINISLIYTFCKHQVGTDNCGKDNFLSPAEGSLL